MSPEVRAALGQLRQAFVARHGRGPGLHDLLFPDMPHPEHLEVPQARWMTNTMPEKVTIAPP
jgi:hypothetical protein